MIGNRRAGVCPDCQGRTARGGRALAVDPGTGDRYEVRVAGEVIGGPFRSAVAAATFAAGHPGATVHERIPV